MKNYLFSLLPFICFFSPTILLSQPDTVYYFDFEDLKVDINSRGDVLGSIRNNKGEFQDAKPFETLTVAYGNSHKYKNAEFGNYPVGKLFLYHSPSWLTPDKKGVSFNHIELTLDSSLAANTYYKFSFLVANMKSHRFKPSHYGVKFSVERIIKEGPGKLLAEPDIYFSFTNDSAFEEIQAVLHFDFTIRYIYFGIFSEDTMRVPKKFTTLSHTISYSDTAAYIQMAKPTRIMLDNILIETLDTIDKLFGDIYYKLDEDAIYKAEDFKLIYDLAERLKANPDTYLLIQGSTDNTGSFAYNIDLSRRRAEKIKALLINKGIESHRVITIGKGINQIGNSERDASNARKVSFKLLH